MSDDHGERVVRRLDFSQFHMTADHWPFSAYCRTQYGGGRRHLALAWEYHRRDQVICWLWRALLLCRWHAHRLQTWHAADGDTYTTICKCCSVVRPATPEEIAAFGPRLRFVDPDEL